ncbi:MAG: stage II sporulation protein M [Alphaproteobacteria bacterium]|nr:stage II sporulation protein M [Alphaproteobacteria bacterium]
MTDTGDLKSTRFRRERERVWQEFDTLVTRFEKSGLRGLDSNELARLPVLYRAVLSSLSVARSISLDRNVLTYLENLASRGYFSVYSPRTPLRRVFVQFFAVGFRRAVRQARWHIGLAAFLMALGGVAGFVVTAQSPDLFYTLVPPGLAGDRGPASSTEDLYDVLVTGPEIESGQLSVFASFLFTHNTRIGFLALALGFALGLPTALLLFQNGLILGAMLAIYTARGLFVDFSGWLLIHGVTELAAIILCGGAGLFIGHRVIFPGRHGRLSEVMQAGRVAARIAVGAVVLFLIAGVLEGFGRQTVIDTSARLTIAAVTLILLAAYFVWPARRAP